jgi:hypothetical protein
MLTGTRNITPDLLALQMESLTPENNMIQGVSEPTEGTQLRCSPPFRHPVGTRSQTMLR